MNDPILHSLARHERSLDRDQAIRDHIDHLLEEDPDSYAGMSDEGLYEAALEDLEDQAAEAAIARYEDSRYGA